MHLCHGSSSRADVSCATTMREGYSSTNSDQKFGYWLSHPTMQIRPFRNSFGKEDKVVTVKIKEDLIRYPNSSTPDNT